MTALMVGVFAGAQTPITNHRLNFTSYVLENRQILSKRKRDKLQVAFQEGSGRTVASDPAGIPLPPTSSPSKDSSPINGGLNGNMKGPQLGGNGQNGLQPGAGFSPANGAAAAQMPTDPNAPAAAAQVPVAPSTDNSPPGPSPQIPVNVPGGPTN